MDTLPDSLRAIYPFRNNYFEINNHRLHYLDEGVGEVVLMLHGNPTWSFYYRNLVLGLRDRFRCIVPDHMGCGLSSKPQDYPYCLQTHIDNVYRLLEHLELDKIHLILHDWGGAIGMGLGQRLPERIDKIVLLNTAAFLSKRIPLSLRICRLPGIGALLVRGLNGFSKGATSMTVCKEMAPEVKEGYLWPYDSWNNRVAILRFVQDIPMRPGHPAYSLLRQIDHGLSVFQDRPILICWGGSDWCFDDFFLDEWKHRFPTADVHRFADAGHYVLEDALEEIVPLVRRFL